MADQDKTTTLLNISLNTRRALKVWAAEKDTTMSAIVEEVIQRRELVEPLLEGKK